LRQNQRRGRAVDISRRGEGVKTLLRLDDRGVGFLDRILAGIHLLPGERSGITGRLDLDDRLVDALLLELHPRSDILQALVRLGHVGDQGCEAVGLLGRLCLRQTGRGQRDGSGEGQRTNRPGSANGARTAGRSHTTTHSTPTPTCCG
jgi:hypothetical protein